MRKPTYALAVAGVAALLLGTGAIAEEKAAVNPGEVNVYSYRQPVLIEPMFNAFTRDTGVKVNVEYVSVNPTGPPGLSTISASDNCMRIGPLYNLLRLDRFDQLHHN